MHGEVELLAPHGVERVAVDGFGAEVVAVDGHAQNVHLDAGAARAVARTHVLTGNNLQEKELLDSSRNKKGSFINYQVFYFFFY